MASFSRSFKPSFFRGSVKRPPMSGRTLSNSSDTSSCEDQFIMSGTNTPISENPSGLVANPPMMGFFDRGSSPSSGIPRSNSSRPITIEPPNARKISNGPTCTPPEPLSARGDLPGGYFPLHEDPTSRVHRPHPFHRELKSVRQHHSNQVAGTSENWTPTTDPVIITTMSDTTTSLDGRSSTPVTSYMPTGARDSPLPMGKYYPSNYESRPSSQATLQPPRSQYIAPSSVKSDSQVPRLHLEASNHSRTDSDAKRRLLQYQRDMVAQATLAARQVMGASSVSSASSASSAPRSAALPSASMRSLHFSGAFVAKPLSPRLQPLGSPGPVTPMDLGSGGDTDYLARGALISSPDAEREREEIIRAVRMEDERRRREGATSPAVEFGPVTF